MADAATGEALAEDNLMANLAVVDCVRSNETRYPCPPNALFPLCPFSIFHHGCGFVFPHAATLKLLTRLPTDCSLPHLHPNNDCLLSHARSPKDCFAAIRKKLVSRNATVQMRTLGVRLRRLTRARSCAHVTRTGARDGREELRRGDPGVGGHPHFHGRDEVNHTGMLACA